VLRFEQTLPATVVHARRKYAAKRLAVEKAYDEWLFHGPVFQVIEKIDGLSEEGVLSNVRSTSPAEWLPSVASATDRWVFEPALIDAAAQVAILWANMFRDESCLPAKYGRVVRYRDQLPRQLIMDFERVESKDPSYIAANVYFCDKDGSVVLAVEELECIASAALKRLGGTAKAGRTEASRHD
jgi:hypothetical protein